MISWEFLKDHLKPIEESAGSQEQVNMTEEPGSKSSSDALRVMIDVSLNSELSENFALFPI